MQNLKSIIGADFPKKGSKKESVKGLALIIGIGFFLTYVLLSRMDNETLTEVVGFTSVGSGMLEILLVFVCAGSFLMIPLWLITRNHVKRVSEHNKKFGGFEGLEKMRMAAKKGEYH